MLSEILARYNSNSSIACLLLALVALLLVVNLLQHPSFVLTRNNQVVLRFYSLLLLCSYWHRNMIIFRHQSPETKKFWKIRTMCVVDFFDYSYTLICLLALLEVSLHRPRTLVCHFCISKSFKERFLKNPQIFSQTIMGKNTN